MYPKLSSLMSKLCSRLEMYGLWHPETKLEGRIARMFPDPTWSVGRLINISWSISWPNVKHTSRIQLDKTDVVKNWKWIATRWNTFSILSLHPSLNMEANSPSSSYISNRAVKNEYQSYLGNGSQKSDH